jgi:hypothetical protein
MLEYWNVGYRKILEGNFRIHLSIIPRFQYSRPITPDRHRAIRAKEVHGVSIVP